MYGPFINKQTKQNTQSHPTIHTACSVQTQTHKVEFMSNPCHNVQGKNPKIGCNPKHTHVAVAMCTST